MKVILTETLICLGLLDAAVTVRKVLVGPKAEPDFIVHRKGISQGHCRVVVE